MTLIKSIQRIHSMISYPCYNLRTLNHFCLCCECVCVGLSINEIINIMFYYSFYLLSFFYLLNLPINVALFHLSLLSHSHILFLNTNPDFISIFHLQKTINQCIYLLNFFTLVGHNN